MIDVVRRGNGGGCRSFNSNREEVSSQPCTIATAYVCRTSMPPPFPAVAPDAPPAPPPPGELDDFWDGHSGCMVGFCKVSAQGRMPGCWCNVKDSMADGFPGCPSGFQKCPGYSHVDSLP